MKTPSKAPGLLAVIAGGPGAKPPMSAETEPDDLELAAEEFLSAVKSGDAAAVADAFRSMSSLCSYKGEDEE